MRICQVPPCYAYCHTRLHLGFSAMLRIWQVPACKMEQQSGNISWKNHPPNHMDFLELILCAVSPPQCEYVIKFWCAVSPPCCPQLFMYWVPPCLIELLLFSVWCSPLKCTCGPSTHLALSSLVSLFSGGERSCHFLYQCPVESSGYSLSSLGTVKKLRNPLRGRGVGCPKITEDYDGGRGDTPRDCIGLGGDVKLAPQYHRQWIIGILTFSINIPFCFELQHLKFWNCLYCWGCPDGMCLLSPGYFILLCNLPTWFGKLERTI